MRAIAPAVIFATLVPLILMACTTERATSPQRTATEELLISTAADRAAEELAKGIPTNIKIYLDTNAISGPDAGYAASAIRDRFLRRGVALVGDRAAADAIVDVRAGALSTDEHSLYLGTPDFPLPIVSGVTGQPIIVPSLSLFKRAETKATAKFAATGYDPKTGKLVVATDAETQSSRKVDWSILLLFAWTDEDYLMMPKR